MSIDPVQTRAAANAAQPVQAHDDPAHATGPQVRHDRVHPNSGMQPNRESPVHQRDRKVLEMPQDEVQVQRDSQNQIVIKYLDGSGKVIFQVPSSQVLALQQAIEQALEQQAQSRTAADGETAVRGRKNF